MGYIDREFAKLVKNILTEGNVSHDKTRGVDTIQIPSYTLDIQPRENQAVILTTKKVNYYNILTELLWFMRGDTNIKYLVDNGVNIWNKDAYNYYLRLCAEDPIATRLTFKSFIKAIEGNVFYSAVECPTGYVWGDLGPVYGAQWRNQDGVDQFKILMDNLYSKNFNRRLIVNAWNPKELGNMALPPCHWAFEILPEVKGEEVILHLKWHQRSVDVFLGLPYNITSYDTLLKMICDFTGYKKGRLLADLSNLHIYSNAIDASKQLLTKSPYKYMAPNYETNAFYKYLIETKTPLYDAVHHLQNDSIVLDNYKSEPFIKVEMLAPLK